MLVGMSAGRSRLWFFSDDQWELIAPLLPSSDGRAGRRFRNNRKVVEGIVYRYRTGIECASLKWPRLEQV